MNGLMAFGKLVSFKSDAWEKDPTKFNYSLGIQVGSYKNAFGQEIPNTLSLNLTADQYKTMSSQTDFIGKDVHIEFAEIMRKGGKSGQWLQHYVPATGKLVLQK